MGIRVAAFLALFVACASAASMTTSTWLDSGKCSGAPDGVVFMSNFPLCSETKCVGEGSESVSIECGAAYSRPGGAVFVNVETYTSATCDGTPSAAVATRADECDGSSGVYAKFSCGADGAVISHECTDSACKSCTTVTLSKDCTANTKYVCSSGVRTFAVAGITATVAAVASFWSM